MGEPIGNPPELGEWLPPEPLGIPSIAMLVPLGVGRFSVPAVARAVSPDHA